MAVEKSNSISFPIVNNLNLRSSLHLQHGSTEPKTSRNPLRHHHRLTRVHSPNSFPNSNLPRRTRRRVETRSNSPKLIPHRLTSPNRVSTRRRRSRFPPRPYLPPSLFNMGTSPRNDGFRRYLEAWIQIQTRFSLLIFYLL